MKNQKSKNFRLGLLVLIGTALLISALYFVGSKQNLLGSKIQIIAEFKDVNGLMKGNNVNFSGINIGTVESVGIATDTSIRVVMVIQKSAQEFIKKNAIASIGTDGLMGNKLVNLNVNSQPSDSVQDGDTLATMEPVATEQMMHILNRTNEDIAYVVHNLKEISDKLNNSNHLWSILSDSSVSENIKITIADMNRTSRQSTMITEDIFLLIQGVKDGKGALGNLVTESELNSNLELTIQNIQAISDSLANVTADLNLLVKDIKDGKGAIGTLLKDSIFVSDLTSSLENIRKGSDGFNQNMEALKHSIFLRRYFRKQKKESEKMGYQD